MIMNRYFYHYVVIDGTINFRTFLILKIKIFLGLDYLLMIQNYINVDATIIKK